jgi:hypothetical protein
MPLSPGDGKSPRSFIDIDGNEQQLAAYLGYNDVSQLRLLTMSWPVLNSILIFDKIAKNMNKRSALQLIHDRESDYVNVAMHEVWPISKEDDEATLKHKKSRWLAVILLLLEGDLKRLRYMEGFKYFAQEQIRAIDTYREQNPERTDQFPDVKYAAPGTIPNPERMEVTPPVLGPYKGEDRLESINRCWHLLKYFRACRAAKGQWSKKFSPTAIVQRIQVDISHVPDWMKPCEAEEQLPEIPKTKAVVAADALAPIKISIVWDKDEPFDEKDELDAALKTAKGRGIVIPGTDMVLLQDPRLCKTGEFFRDSIRRQFNCQKIGIDIRVLDLQYKNLSLSKGIKEKDILRDTWEQTKSTFEDANNSEFTIHVQFQATDEPDNIWESFEAPPAVEAFFNISGGDVELNPGGINEIVVEAFGDNVDDRFEDVVETDDIDGLPHFLDLAFAHGGSANEIGSAPKPKKFSGPNAHAKFLAHYDDHDVREEEVRIDWQNSLLKEATRNGKVANVKTEKMPKEFSEDDKAAIEKAEALGLQLAMAKGEDKSIVSSSTSSEVLLD